MSDRASRRNQIDPHLPYPSSSLGVNDPSSTPTTPPTTSGSPGYRSPAFAGLAPIFTLSTVSTSSVYTSTSSASTPDSSFLGSPFSPAASSEYFDHSEGEHMTSPTINPHPHERGGRLAPPLPPPPSFEESQKASRPIAPSPATNDGGGMSHSFLPDPLSTSGSYFLGRRNRSASSGRRRSSQSMAAVAAGSSSRRKLPRVKTVLCVFVTLLALFLVGTVVVLTTVQMFGVWEADEIIGAEIGVRVRSSSAAGGEHLAGAGKLGVGGGIGSGSGSGSGSEVDEWEFGGDVIRGDDDANGSGRRDGEGEGDDILGLGMGKEAQSELEKILDEGFFDSEAGNTGLAQLREMAAKKLKEAKTTASSSSDGQDRGANLDSGVEMVGPARTSIQDLIESDFMWENSTEREAFLASLPVTPPLRTGERIPRLIHQTWKSDMLPERWQSVSEGCRRLMHDYSYMLWTDSTSRKFIATFYPWFLPTFDSYPYPIQRADSIRYFVLYHYGGVYMDLDVGCRKRVDPLLRFGAVLPRTKPVGVSNDLMFSEQGGEFMDLVIHSLVTFNRVYGTNYPTVMFSTGPMFLSFQYNLWPHRAPSANSVRILPKIFYGKNAEEEEAKESFFWHYYGSSWHDGDAGFVTFLGNFGRQLMYLGLIILFVGMSRLIWFRSSIRAAPIFYGRRSSSGGGSSSNNANPPMLWTPFYRSNGPVALPFAAYDSEPSIPSSSSSSRRPSAFGSGAGYWFFLPSSLFGQAPAVAGANGHHHDSKRRGGRGLSPPYPSSKGGGRKREKRLSDQYALTSIAVDDGRGRGRDEVLSGMPPSDHRRVRSDGVEEEVDRLLGEMEPKMAS